MNDRSRRYEPEAMARIYRQSKIIVNIARDDFSQDTNLTTIEEMPEAALLLTSLPAEPAQIGFEDGVHFVVFRKEAEIAPLGRKYLLEESTRHRIAEVARDKVLSEHSYDETVQPVLELAKQNGRKFSLRRDPGPRNECIWLTWIILLVTGRSIALRMSFGRSPG